MTGQDDTVGPLSSPLPFPQHALRIWVLTDGKAGDEQQCIGIAEALVRNGLDATVETRRVNPRRLFSWAMPRGPIDPREAPARPGSPIAPPFPDMLVASGRRSIAYVRHVKRASLGRCFTVVLKDPRTGPGTADFIWAPRHDRITGANVLKTLTSPHQVSQARLALSRANPPPWLTALPSPRVAVLVGGDSRHHRFAPENIAAFTAHLATLAASGVGLMGSRSRRTPEPLAHSMAGIVRAHGGWWWDGTGPNPYTDLLAHADAVVVTADSVNMISEATATGQPVLVYEPSGGHAKIGKFLDGLTAAGAVHHFVGRLEGEAYPPLDATEEIAADILRRYAAHAARLYPQPASP